MKKTKQKLTVSLCEFPDNIAVFTKSRILVRVFLYDRITA